MNQFFIKNETFALIVDERARPYKKAKIYICSACDNCEQFVIPQEGFLVETPLTKKDLKDLKILVSSIEDIYEPY